MAKNDQLWKAASALVSSTKTAILTTANNIGYPHATWMNVLAESQMDKVIAITAPHTQKAENLRENPYSEWMFASTSMESVVYLSGPTEIVTGEEGLRYWNEMPGKAKAPYHHYSPSEHPEDFAILCTRVEKVIYCRPPGYHKTVVHEL
jgi:general stress protein 26